VRLGILGGAFNPPHLGHLVCGQEAQIQLELEQVVLVPARLPPHKVVQDEPGASHRFELCRRAVEGDGRFTVSDLELRREGPSYTVDTLRELHAGAQDTELFLILGADAAIGLPRWHEPNAVVSAATVAVTGRDSIPAAAVDGALEPLGVSARFFDMPSIGVSSTMLRERTRQRLPISYLTPAAVVSYIEEHRLYRSSA
jgi:nicotinate-nucleotide adenylyltransferase